MTEIPTAPEWTDYTPSDPGITFLQLVAYIAEGLLGVTLIAVSWRYARRWRRTFDSSPGGTGRTQTR